MSAGAAAVPLAVEAAAVPIRTASPVDEADDEADALIRTAPLAYKAAATAVAAAAAVPIRTAPPVDNADDDDEDEDEASALLTNSNSYNL